MSGRRIGMLVVALMCVTVALGVFDRSPQELPDVALGSVVLLQLERVAVAIAVVAFVATVVVRGMAGDLPVKFGSAGLEYSPEPDAASLQRRVAMLERQLAAKADGRGGAVVSSPAAAAAPGASGAADAAQSLE